MNEFVSLNNAIRILRWAVYALGVGQREYAKMILESGINDLKRLAEINKE